MKNTPTEEKYTDDVCSVYEYNTVTKECMVGTINSSLSMSGTTKTMRVKYVEPWLQSVTKGYYSCNVENSCCGEDVDGSCCTSDNPCNLGEGDCDTDEHCIGDLVCGTNNCDTSLGLKQGN